LEGKDRKYRRRSSIKDKQPLHAQYFLPPYSSFATLRTLDKTSLSKLPYASMLIIVEMINFQR
jgi:hypothetical protein